jgi:hypothetical protein
VNNRRTRHDFNGGMMSVYLAPASPITLWGGGNAGTDPVSPLLSRLEGTLDRSESDQPSDLINEIVSWSMWKL